MGRDGAEYLASEGGIGNREAGEYDVGKERR
jgi:hypothetical protein